MCRLWNNVFWFKVNQWKEFQILIFLIKKVNKNFQNTLRVGIIRSINYFIR